MQRADVASHKHVCSKHVSCKLWFIKHVSCKLWFIIHHTSMCARNMSAGAMFKVQHTCTSAKLHDDMICIASPCCASAHFSLQNSADTDHVQNVMLYMSLDAVLSSAEKTRCVHTQCGSMPHVWLYYATWLASSLYISIEPHGYRATWLGYIMQMHWVHKWPHQLKVILKSHHHTPAGGMAYI